MAPSHPAPPLRYNGGNTPAQERAHGQRTGPADRTFPLRRLSRQAQPAGPRAGPKQAAPGGASRPAGRLVHGRRRRRVPPRRQDRAGADGGLFHAHHRRPL